MEGLHPKLHQAQVNPFQQSLQLGPQNIWTSKLLHQNGLTEHQFDG